MILKLRLKLIVSAGLGTVGLAAWSPAGAADPACSNAAVTAAGSAVRAARTQLSALPLAADGSSVPPATRRRIEATKDDLRDFVRAEMACAEASPEPGKLADEMMAHGGFIDDRPSDPEAESVARHGDRLQYDVSRVAGHPRMLAIVATLGIYCGSDSMLLLYRRSAVGWEEVMVRRSEPYAEIKGGWGDLRFAVSPPDEAGRWFVATVSTTPWCTSAWQGMPYALARPGPAPDRPDIFFRRKGTTYLGGDEDLLLHAERDAFELRNTAGSLDPEVHSRRHVRRYAVRGDAVRRVHPVAESVRDFVDEWVVSPWTEAKDWSGEDPEIARGHARLHPDPYSRLDQFASIRACENGLTQVEIGADEGPSWFFLVRDHKDSPWILERVARQAAASCSGPDQLARERA